MPTSIANLAVILSANSAQLQADLQRARSMVGQFGQQINKDSFDKRGDQLAKTMEMTRPVNVKRSAGIELMESAAERRRSHAVEVQKLRFQSQLPFGQEKGEALGQKFQLQGMKLAKSLGMGEKGMEAMGAAGLQIGEALGPLAAAAGPIGIVVAGVAALGAAAVVAHKAFVSFASFANPASAERYQRAWDDMTAVIGARLVPYLNFASKVVRMFGDFLQSILPSSQDVQALFNELEPILQDFRDALAAVAPYLREFAKASLQSLGLMLKAAAFVTQFIPGLGALAAAARENGLRLESSFGMAPRAASFVGIEELSKQNVAAGFSAGKNDPAMETANNTARMQQNTEVIAGVLTQNVGFLAGLGFRVGAASAGTATPGRV